MITKNDFFLLKGLNILVAEDNSLNQRIAKFILQKQGAESTIVNNGGEAIEQLQQGGFDAVLMDLQMPEVDGYEATAYIRQTLKSNIPIIALSASTLEADERKCLDAGMNACISKPFDPNELCELILKLLKK